MTKTVAKVIYHGIYRIIFDDSQKYNPYRIIYTANNHQKQIARYADFPSCMYHICHLMDNR